MENFFRKTNLKFTVKTAGFGMNESMKISNYYEEIKEDSNSEDETPRNLKEMEN